ncbi:MAG: histidine kinase [Bacteroidetes bacterium]|nr:histidine kinase [Bacteroidota bacterium]
MEKVEMTRDESEKIHTTLRTVRKHLSRIHHDLNNPLAIVSGNVQLLDELSKALQVGDEFEVPIQDVMVAVEQLTEITEELLVLRNVLAQLEENSD